MNPQKLVANRVYYNFTNASSYHKYKNFFVVLLVASVFIAASLPFVYFANDVSGNDEKIILDNLQSIPEVVLYTRDDSPAPRNVKCTHWNCFNIYRCGHSARDRLTVYVYPFRKYVSEMGDRAIADDISKEFYTILSAIVNSKYYTSNPREACLFVPSIDTLNQERLDLNLTSRALKSLPYWSNGENHLIFNMIAGTAPDFSPVVDLDLGNAMVAGSDFDSFAFRPRFDVPLPQFSPVANLGELSDINSQRPWLVVSAQLNIDPYYLDELQKMAYRYRNSLLLLDACHPHKYAARCDVNSDRRFVYPRVLRKSTFCLIFRGKRIGQMALHEAMAANCVPVVAIDGCVLPFSDVIDWKRVAVFVMESHLGTLMDVLRGVSPKRIETMRKALKFYYDTYFSTLEKVALTTLDVIQERAYPHSARTYDDVNLTPEEVNENPLFFPSTASRASGFTSVILTYDRVTSLYTLIERLAKVPSLAKIVVVWNNQKKNPPPPADFPKIEKPISVIRTKANHLSNRFYPYKEIETEGVLHIDDDIVMLTADEVEFAFEVWREFPDRIVGFPSRTHVWNNGTRGWRYESEWLNEISMVLTGAAFLHKYWSYLYTTRLPGTVRDWVDDNMNCEDIAMNFLVANVTGKPPVKVTPRKKFKCPECTNTETLSADWGHMIARSQCVDRFARAFGRMPLRSVEFRADPVLFKDAFPEKLKRFNDIGSL
ncbi:exostosin-2 [Cylas formicarius]|uniref:exostosin-2 n=1 Tax=Cylas formicarius TaxID=197179 RepID=UPI0029587979|nr:exostosin-2 [Cylas formicarius]XP_060524633.1 exostosin-2 [Cylas formicarius]